MKRSLKVILILIFSLHYFTSLNAQKVLTTGLQATVAGLSEGKINVNFLISDGKVSCTDTTIKVTSFTIGMIVKSDLIERNISGFSFLAIDVFDYLTKVKPGDKVCFTKIRAKAKNGTTIKLPSITFTLTS
jgi:hypothetical protein